MVSFTTLQDTKPSEFEQAADGYHAVSSAAGEAKDRLSQHIMAKALPSPDGAAATGDGLTGEGAVAARRRLERLEHNCHYAQVECGLISAALNGFASEVRAAKRKLTSAVDEAESAGFKVGADGSVSWIPDTPLVPEQRVTAKDSSVPLADPDPSRVKALGFADRIQDALNDAAEADQKWAPKLQKLKAQNDLTVSAKDWANVHGDQRALQKVADDYLSKGDIPQDKSPEENAAWWNSLNDQQKSDYVSLYPASLGALDGLPAEVRDEANRAVLAEKRGHYEMRLDAIPPKPQGLYAHPGGSQETGWREQQERVADWEAQYGAEYARLQGALSGMDAIENRFDRTGQAGLPEAYLLGFDPEGKGDGKVILANGNPDTADRVATFVPGTGAGIEAIGSGDDHGDLGRGERLWQNSDRLSPGESISTITWLDYNAPDSIAPGATAGGAADRGGETLREFIAGNRVAHDNASSNPAHNTVIGHSYGSTVVGEAAQSVNYDDNNWSSTPLADEIVLAGSPGVQADHARDLGVGSDHVWAMGSSGWDDRFVRHGGRIVGLGDDLTIPTDESFGASIMENDSPGHSGFWNQDSQSLRNQAAVITGRHDRITLE